MIYYTIDGTTPSIHSPAYNGPFTLNGPWGAVQAIASAPGYSNSAEASAVYTLNSTVSELTVSGVNPYQMTCNVSAAGNLGAAGPTGTATFTDTTTGTTLATAPLATPSLSRRLVLLSQNATETGYDITPVVADLNGDNHPDLIFGSAVGIQVLLGNGDGTFQPAALVVNSANQTRIPASIAVADFNGDGKPDLVYTMAPSPAGVESTEYGVLLGNGDGTFQAPTYYDAGIPLGWVVAGDFRGNGKQDLAGTNRTAGSNTIDILLGNGNGTFQTPVAYTVGSQPTEILTGDFNGDGKPDLAVANQNDYTISVLLGNEDGTFQPQMATPSLGQSYPIFMVAADFNHDGRLDLAISLEPAVVDEYGSVAILLGNGDGTFQYPGQTITALGDNAGIAAADFNQDGSVDLAISDYPGLQSESSGPRRIQIMQGVGDGTFSPGYSVPIPTYAGVLSATDLNGDGYPDLVAGNFALINVLSASASATAANVTVTPGSSATHELQCTYNGDTNYASSNSNLVAEKFDQVAPPAFSLLVGVYNAPQTVTITDATLGPVFIYYTTDGSTPTVNSTLYTGPITISSPTTFKAIGVETGYLTSVVSEASYILAATPQLSPPPGTYTGAQSVTITDSTPSATIYYTTDGSTPTTHSAIYSSAIQVNPGSTVQAMATSPNYLNSVVVSGTYSASKATTTTSLSASATPANENQQITLMATVTGNSPTGTVTFSASNITLGTALLTNGTAVLTTSFANAGTYNVTASYGGDGGNTSSVSSVVAITVVAPGPSISATSLSASITSANENQQITLTATVTGNNPTGTVTFSASNSTLGTASLTNGTAVLTTSFANAGTYNVTANYGGDGGNTSSVSSVVAITVVAPAYSISANPSSQTIQAGHSAQFTITVTPAGGFSSAVDFSCGTLPGEATCSFSPSSVFPNGGPASTTLTISTMASTAKLEQRSSPWVPASGLALAGVLGLSLGRRRRYNRMMRLLSGVLILSAAIAAGGGCGGGANNSDGGGGNPGTPAGSYTVSVSASASGEPAQGLQLSLMVN